MASRRAARNRQLREPVTHLPRSQRDTDPESVLTNAEAAVTFRPSSRNRRRVLAARALFAQTTVTTVLGRVA